MNRIRKFGNWLWLNKERMVLAVMVCFLIFRVYQVVRPPVEDPKDVLGPPKRELPEGVATPGTPPPTPVSPRAQDWSPLWRFSPFNYRQPRIGQSSGNADASQEVTVRLLNIKQVSPGKYMAQIQTPSRSSWYSAGDAFETYELLEIDPDTQTVLIYAEQLTKTIELKVGQ